MTGGGLPREARSRSAPRAALARHLVERDTRGDRDVERADRASGHRDDGAEVGALHEERPLAAREYLEQALRLNPKDRRSRSALSRLLPEDARRIREAVAAGSEEDDEDEGLAEEDPSTG